MRRADELGRLVRVLDRGQLDLPMAERNRLLPAGGFARIGDISLFTEIATLGAPFEVTAANLAIETFLPVDAASAARLCELAEQPAAARA